MIDILVVDDDHLMRAGLVELLGADPDLRVVAEAATGREAVDAARRTSPQVVLMDVQMPDLDGIAATAELARCVPEARVLILTTFENDDYLFGALRAGASGFLLKRSRPEDLIAAVHTVAAGEAMLAPSATRRVIDAMTRTPAPRADSATVLARLTPREREVLTQLARGLANREIAEVLVVEESTVRTHVKRVFMKLALRDRVQAVILAYECGLVQPGSTPGRQDDS